MGATAAPGDALSTLITAPENMDHTAVLLEEAVDALNIQVDGTYIDCTFGRGGHSRLILERLGVNGRLIAIDRDLQALATAKEIKDDRFHIEHLHFSELNQLAIKNKLASVDGILLDLGVSSPQIDEGKRGFSFRFDGPLDMRMDQTSGKTAAEILAAISEKKLSEVIKNYGEERFAKQVARAIIKERTDGHPIATTAELAKIVASAIHKVEPGQNPATRTFQALRIFVNKELEELSLVLPQCLEFLAPKGRLVVISFHSLEDRIVKRFLKSEMDRDDFPVNFPVKAKDLPQPRLKAVGKAVKPGMGEVKRNSRARSAVMRVAMRTAIA